MSEWVTLESERTYNVRLVGRVQRNTRREGYPWFLHWRISDEEWCVLEAGIESTAEAAQAACDAAASNLPTVPYGDHARAPA